MKLGVAKGTLIKTPRGTRAIEKISIKDKVLDEGGNVLDVVKIKSAGVGSVYPVFHRGTKELLVKAAPDQRLLVWSGKLYSQGVTVSPQHLEKDTFLINGFGHDNMKVDVGEVVLAEIYEIHVDSFTNMCVLASGAVLAS